MPYTPVINNFNAGELSPFLWARNDVNKYNSGCLEMENFQVLPYGGAVRRPAIEFIAASKQDDKIRLISFEFSSEQTYIIELGDEYMRFFKDGEPVELDDEIYEIETPYSADDLFQVKFVQSADVMWFVHQSYPPQRLERYGDTDWTMEEMVPDYPPLLERVYDDDDDVDDTTLTPSATTGDITVTATDDVFEEDHVGSRWLIRHVRDDNTLKKLDGTDTTEPPDPNGTNTITGRGTMSLITTGTWDNNDMTVWRSPDDGDTWEQFRSYNMKDRNVDTSWEEEDDGIIYACTATSAGTSGKVRLSVYEYYTHGIFEITGYTSATEVSATVIDELGDTEASANWIEGAWSDYRGYPQAIALWESRLIFAGTPNNPNTLWLSRTEDFQHFYVGSLDSDAMKLTLGSGRIDEIRWLVPQRYLVIGTVGSEWALEPESDNEPVTPTSYSIKRKTTYGSKNIQAVLINSAVLFVMRQGRKVREFTYRYDIDDYAAPDMTIMSEHVTYGGITTMAYQQQPDNVLLCIREDGTMIPMTYERDQDVTGWYRWNLNDGDGLFESVTVIPRDSAEDEVWVSAQLTVDGETKRYIGRFDSREWGTDVATEWNGSDFYTVFDSPESTTLSGLDYLEGMTVDVVRDGMALVQATVTDGEIEIDKVGDRVVVGVPYTSTIAPAYIEPPNQQQPPMGKKKAIYKAVIRFKDTITCKAGRDADNLRPVIFRNTSDAMDSQYDLFSGEKKITFDNQYGLLHTCYVVQDQPLPITVIAMIPWMEITDD